MPLISILYEDPSEIPLNTQVSIPEFFQDLNLDQMMQSINDGMEEYHLDRFFNQKPEKLSTVNYRQQVFRDLESSKLLAALRDFSAAMVIVNRYLKMIDKLYYRCHKEGWFLEAILLYCDAVTTLAGDLNGIPVESSGLQQVNAYFQQYSQSAKFIHLKQEALEVKSQLQAIRYNIIIDGGTVQVRKYELESDYSTEVEKTFGKFKQDKVKNYRVDLGIPSGMNHIERQIIDFVAKLFPEEFQHLSKFCGLNLTFLDETIQSFYNEIQFYLSYLFFIERFKTHGLKFCLPEVTDKSKEISANNTFDLALANRQPSTDLTIVCNDFYLTGSERIIIVSGPNQGGKTTFARTFGQLHYLASLGCPVPGSQAKLFYFDNIYTHFEKEEDIRNQRGKLQDDLMRIHNIIQQATSNSIIIMNEIFTSTALVDARFLSTEILHKILSLDALGVCVSFIDELSRLNAKTVSMVSTIDPSNPTIRTFKILRRVADGHSYAISIAEKHGLTYKNIIHRISDDRTLNVSGS